MELTDFDYKMDYVVGNPPYCNVRYLSECNYKLVKNQYSFCDKGTTDLYLAFFEKGIKMLNGTGVLGYITPNSWLFSKAGENLRQFLYNQNILSALYNFDIDKLFDNATTFTCASIIVNGRKTNDKIKVYQGDFDKVNEYRLTNKEDLYYNGKICTCSDNTLIKNILDYKIKDENKQFVVKNGLLTTNNKLFIIEKSIGNTDNVPQGIKASKGKSKYIIYPYDKDDMPVRYGDLSSQIRDLLEERAKRLDIDTNKPNWWLYGRTQAIKDTNKYRISCNYLIRSGNDVILRPLPPLTAVYGGYYIMRNGMIQSEHDMTHLFCQVEEALQSDLFTNFIKSIGKSKNGGYYTFSTKDVEIFLNYFYGC